MKYTHLFLASAILLSACTGDADPTPPPVAAFTLTQTGEQSMPVSFQNQSLNATRYSWDFGDKTTSLEENPTHTYESIGSYSVKLMAYGSNKVDSVTKLITIEPYHIFAHSNMQFAGMYACKVVHSETPPFGTARRWRLPNEDVTITQEGLNTIRWDKNPLQYDGFFDYPQFSVLPNYRFAFSSSCVTRPC
jgi:PKD repeat protein